MNIEDKLSTVKYNPDHCSHLTPNPNMCRVCKSKICQKVCPARVYEWIEDDEKLIVKFENCLECGACKIVCEKKSLGWQYPKGTKGVIFKNG